MNAMPQEKAMTPINGQFELTPVCDSLRCRYHASVMNTLLAISRRMVYNPDIFNCLINKGTRNSTFPAVLFLVLSLVITCSDNHALLLQHGVRHPLQG